MRGGKRKGAGRKPGSTKETPRNIVKQVRWTVEEWQQVEASAHEAKQTPSEFVRSATLTKVQDQ